MPPGCERVLTERELNRALLERQFLLERKQFGLPKALERIGGIQAQYAPSMYIGLWSRLRGFERSQLTRALERRSVVQGTLMRMTIHLVSAGDYWPFAAGIREPRKKAWLDYQRGRVSAKQVGAAAATLRRRMKQGQSARKELIEGMDNFRFNGANVWLDIVRVPPAGTWERPRADMYGLAEDWLEPSAVTAAQGRELLVRRYLQGFGPAAPRE
ncbi:MAG: winged helix DNA-binding domain-containing protein, partial [Actinomycetota bacterium]|nr:winged helix DNA-binding domain-containing protein [Actinomycetota bacterium]